MAYEMRPSQRGGQVLDAASGFSYVKQKVSQDGLTSYWVCERRNMIACPGRGKVAGGIFIETQAHSHMPDPVRREVRRFGATVREASTVAAGAVGGAASTSVIYANAVATLSPEAAIAIPLPSSVKKNISNAKRRAVPGIQVPDPIDRDQVLVPGE